MCRNLHTLRIICWWPWQWSGEKAHLGQVLHGMSRLLRSEYGNGWPEHAALIFPAVLDRVEVLKLQGYPGLMLAVVYLSCACLFSIFQLCVFFCWYIFYYILKQTKPTMCQVFGHTPSFDGDTAWWMEGQSLWWHEGFSSLRYCGWILSADCQHHEGRGRCDYWIEQIYIFLMFLYVFMFFLMLYFFVILIKQKIR